MDNQDIVYVISRHYITERKSYLSESTYNLLSGWIRSRRHVDLASCSSHSLPEISCKEGLQTLLQVEAFFKKNSVFTDPLTARLSALLSFEEGEELCERTNDRWDSYKPGFNPELDAVLNRMQCYIHDVLGEFPDFLNEIPKLVKLTAGATATRSRRSSTPFLKVSKKPVCTPGASSILSTLSRFWGYGDLTCRLVTRNRIVFVPKSWKTDRTIACEPEGNSCLQLAFDGYVKTRLLRKGINLSDQTRNQHLARQGSIDDSLSTIDLSMASDTLSYNTVRLLLPEQWFSFLRAVRSQYYEMYQGKREAYHKFSSMGNGATFSLETLIFAAACYAVKPSTYSVYGDDIIIDSDKAEDLIALLAILGFVPNTEKTYITGPVRESCGSYWFGGKDILPVFIRELDSRKTTWCHLVNSLMPISAPFGPLVSFLASIARDKKLPIVPINESTISGVWVHPEHAYANKLIQSKFRLPGYAKPVETWIPKFKSYVAKTPRNRDFSLRSLFLWYLNTQKEKREPYESSWYPISSHKYVRKWVHWIPVVNGPENLYWFSEELLHSTEGRKPQSKV